MQRNLKVNKLSWQKPLIHPRKRIILRIKPLHIDNIRCFQERIHQLVREELWIDLQLSKLQKAVSNQWKSADTSQHLFSFGQALFATSLPVQFGCFLWESTVTTHLVPKFYHGCSLVFYSLFTFLSWCLFVVIVGISFQSWLARWSMIGMKEIKTREISA